MVFINNLPDEKVSVDFGDSSVNDVIGVLSTSDFKVAVTIGLLDGFTKVDKFGVNLEITTLTDPEDIWEYGGLYSYDDDNTAPIISLVSDNAADVQEIIVQGLDINGYEVVQTITLNGTTRVPLTTPLWRVYRMINNGTIDIAGLVYCYTSTGNVPAAGEIRAMINDGHNQTLMTLYTIPMGKVGFLYRGELGMEIEGTRFTSSEYAHCHYESRRFGKVFRVKKAITLISNGASNYQDERTFPDVIPAKTDMRLKVVEVSADMGMWGTFDIMLVDENKFSDAYLAAIGQPGY